MNLQTHNLKVHLFENVYCSQKIFMFLLRNLIIKSDSTISRSSNILKVIVSTNTTWSPKKSKLCGETPPKMEDGV